MAGKDRDLPEDKFGPQEQSQPDQSGQPGQPDPQDAPGDQETLIRKIPLIFVRHTKVDAPAGLCYGQTDLDCGPDFHMAARKISVELEKILAPWDSRDVTLCTSPLKRCVNLAEYLRDGVLAESLQLRICDDRLMEMNFGAFEGRLWDDIPEEESRTWMADVVNFPCPGGESYTGMLARVGDFLMELDHLPLEGPIVMVAHGGIYRCLRVLLDFADPGQTLQEPVPAPGGIAMFEYTSVRLV